MTTDVDIDALVAPLQDEAPSGENLEYDPDFQAVQLAFQNKEWSDVADAALELLSRTRDLRLATWLVPAWIHQHQLDGLCTGMSLLRRMLEDRWEDLHPELEPLDEGLPPTRCNVVATLIDLETTLYLLRRMPLVASRMGSFSYRDYEFATTDSSSGEEFGGDGDESDEDATVSLSEINNLLNAEERSSNAEVFQKLTVAREDLKAIEAKFDAEVGTFSPDLSALESTLYSASQIFADYVDIPVEDEVESGGSEGEAAQPRQAGVGEINSREDAIKALERVAQYFERHEPSSPVPLLLKRASGLVSKSFIEVLAELGPDGQISQIHQVMGIENEY